MREGDVAREPGVAQKPLGLELVHRVGVTVHEHDGSAFHAFRLEGSDGVAHVGGLKRRVDAPVRVADAPRREDGASAERAAAAGRHARS